MAGEIIRKGDPTSHGGVVLEGSVSDICMGKPIAYIGHKVHCPKCKGVFPIVEGIVTTTFYGKGVAVAGMKTSCNAVLIATQFTDTVEWSSGAGGGSGAKESTHGDVGSSPAGASASGSSAENPGSEGVNDTFSYDEQYVLLDDMGEPLTEVPYTIKFESGAMKHGTTDINGRTARYATEGEQVLSVFLGHFDK